MKLQAKKWFPLNYIHSIRSTKGLGFFCFQSRNPYDLVLAKEITLVVSIKRLV
jgi:hypothetical protein